MAQRNAWGPAPSAILPPNVKQEKMSSPVGQLASLQGSDRRKNKEIG